MKLTATALPLAAIAGLALTANSTDGATIAPITGLSSSSGGDRYANGVVSLTNGSGIDKSADPSDPSAWVFSGGAYADELMSWFFKNGDGLPTTGLNGKLAWDSFDLGSSIPLETLYLFNNNYQGGISGVNTYNLYYADSPAVALPPAPDKNTYSITGLTPQGDYDFSSGGWTLFNTSGALTATKNAISTVDLTGISARYLAIEILTNHGDTYQGGRVGLDEVAITAGAGAAAELALQITPHGANYDFSWNSQDGKVYDLVSSTDLATPILDWPVYAGNADIADTAPTNMLSGVAAADPARFFAVIEKDPPPPPLVNGSFENPLTADGTFTSVAPLGWTEFDAGSRGDVGVWNPLVSEHATVPDGENVGYVYHTGSVPLAAFGLSQVLGANFAVDTDYGVTVEVGRSAGYAWPGYRVELWAGASKIAEETKTLVPAADSWVTSTLTYAYSAGDAGLAGEALEIRLLSLGEDPEAAGASAGFEVEFDNVTFTATPAVP